MMYSPNQRPEEEQSNAQEPYPGDAPQPAMDIIDILVLLQHDIPLFLCFTVSSMSEAVVKMVIIVLHVRKYIWSAL
jgi:hypothetical protein